MLFVGFIKKEKRFKISEIDENLFGIDKLNVSRSPVPAITHIDFSARIQTVHKNTNPKYHSLISKFKEITGCPILVNTSFNVRGEPICTPADAFKCFIGTDLDILVIGDYLMLKEDQNENLKIKYEQNYELD